MKNKGFADFLFEKFGFLKMLVFLQFSEVSDCRFGFGMKNCIYIYIATWECALAKTLIVVKLVWFFENFGF